ncbi:MAG: rRNA (guanine966-N2)-methyltransferase [Desulfomicrobiaceae bacterium]|jgi:16S rRNA (guanine966-N2)-methyltransferase|nr:16S rRNA (guanine(966)-N(2))-methyltransferase RsmD [Desulfomicrobiaceae bacterium]MDI3492141.1 rRNA (guanine966-N2)-methyltransferase [Desulfomicrobiaceae bacterium]MDK2872486.1 rRNA (guanine966-N2)-methyltransferase [Desulfomicrobiaceae bacterium]HCF05887.1 16S rRNA (guanine(966)-N(2))-methyltransferase RsmD [Desulfomicrobiaceae bacterium]
MRIIAGVFKGRVLRTACGPGYRPATGRVREALFSTLGSLGVCWQGAQVADVFAGSGALGLEALSRGASQAVFVELAASAARVLQDNIRFLGLTAAQAVVVRMDALRWVQRASGPYHVVFVDPPYGRGLLAPVLAALPALLAPGAVVVAETEASLDVSPTPWNLVRDTLYGQTRIRIWQSE